MTYSRIVVGSNGAIIVPFTEEEEAVKLQDDAADIKQRAVRHAARLEPSDAAVILRALSGKTPPTNDELEAARISLRNEAKSLSLQ